MIFTQDREFPRCGLYIRGPRIDTIEFFSPEIYNALVECCESEKLVKQALTPGRFPRVKIVRLMRNGYPARNIGGNYKGVCDRKYQNIVYINSHIAQGFEDDRTNSLMFESNLLHEIVHWARFVGKKPAEIDGKEAGSWFEHKAFGWPYVGHSDVACPDE